MHKHLILLFFICCAYSNADAQPQAKIDSLEKVLATVAESKKPEILMKLSQLYQSVSLEKSLEYDLQNAALQEKLGSTRNLSGTLNNIGVTYYMMGNYARSLEYFDRSLDIYESLDDTLNIVKTLNNLGVISQVTGQFSLAIDYLQRSLIFKLQLNDTLSTAKTLNNIGVIYKDVGNFDDARNFYLQALKYYTILDDKQGISVVYNNLGQLYELEKDFKNALQFLEKSLELKRITNDERGIGNTLNNMGNISLSKGDLDKAEKLYGEAAEIRERTGDLHGLASTYNSTGNLYLKRKQYDKAEAFFLKSNSIALEHGFLVIIRRNMESLAELYTQSGNLAKAIDHYQKAIAIRDSIFRDDLKKQLNNLKVQYELEKNQQELELLRRENQIKALELSNAQRGQFLLLLLVLTLVLIIVFLVLYQQNRNKKRINLQLKDYNRELETRVKERTSKLEEANATKDRFFSIIAHDLRSPFNGLIGFTDLLHDSYDELTDEEKKEFIKLLKDSTNDVYKLLENLLKWAATQTGKLVLSKENINIEKIVNEIVESSKPNSNKKAIDLHTRIMTGKEAFADAETVKSAIRNLLSNAIKFTHKGGRVDITVGEKHDGATGKPCIEISIEDNGVGMKEEDMQQLFKLQRKVRSSGTDNESGTGLGLILVKEFVEKNDGTISVESQKGRGSRFAFTIPAA
jgi:signal transduction histidine kinase/Tfp pilus assembly protein PilF